MQMILLAAIDRNWAIGKKGSLLYRVPEDLRRFRQLTVGNLVICGRKTLESFPGGKPLPDRETVVLSHQYENRAGYERLTVARTPEEALDRAASLRKEAQSVYVIGGESVYKLFLDRCDTALLTEIDAETPDADAFFPELRMQEGWKAVESSPVQISSSGLSFRYVTYKKENG